MKIDSIAARQIRVRLANGARYGVGLVIGVMMAQSSMTSAATPTPATPAPVKIETSATRTVITPVPPVAECRTEDQSTPCLWAANRRDNKIGTSFVVRPDGSRYVVNSTPKPGSVETSTGRKVRPNRNGCLWLTYAEQGAPEIGDPGDGEWFCAR